MKKLMLVLLSMVILSGAMAQLTAKSKCPDFLVDMFDGKVNGLKPSATNFEIKAKFPCSTSSEEDGTTAKCGTSVFFKDKDIYFYTQRAYIEIGPRFKGKLTVPVMGAKRGSMFQWFGNPKIKDDKWDAYQTSYGTLVLHYDAAGKVNLIQFSTNSTDVLNLCQ
ncbi:MAG TPA: hypothetical protein VGM41_07160 [Chitinophagaceae bacterium]|jgi:hypothetical protein